MNYDNYKGKIVETYGVTLENFPGTVRNPGKIGQREDLINLYDLLFKGTCLWTNLTNDKLVARIAKNKECQAHGKQIYKARKCQEKTSIAKSAEMVEDTDEDSSSLSENEVDSLEAWSTYWWHTFPVDNNTSVVVTPNGENNGSGSGKPHNPYEDDIVLHRQIRNRLVKERRLMKFSHSAVVMPNDKVKGSGPGKLHPCEDDVVHLMEETHQYQPQQYESKWLVGEQAVNNDPTSTAWMRATIQHYSSTKISHIIVVMLYSEEMNVKMVNNEGINKLTTTDGLLMIQRYWEAVDWITPCW